MEIIDFLVFGVGSFVQHTTQSNEGGVSRGGHSYVHCTDIHDQDQN